MDCASAREALWPPERLRVAESGVMDARRHMRSCHECRAYMRWDAALIDLHARSGVEAPPLLRERLLDGHEARRPDRNPGQDVAASGHVHRSRRPMLVAALLLTAVGVVAASSAWLYNLAYPADTPSIYIEDYIRRAVSEDRITTSDADQVARFLTRELGRAARPLETPALAILSAEICILDGVRGAMIQYERDGRVISHYLIPRQAANREATRPRQARTNGIGVVMWAANSFEHALIGELPADSLVALLGETGQP